MASMGDTKGTVLLLKAPTDVEEDRFAEALEQAGYAPLTVPVLAFKFVNKEILLNACQRVDTFSGVIFTSPRSVQAVVRAAEDLGSSIQGSCIQGSGDGKRSVLSSLRCFVVGQTTADAAREANFNPEGVHTGNAENLCQYILDSLSPEERRPLLFPCAQMRRKTIPEKLQNTAYGIHEIIVYETGPNPSIMQDISKVMSSHHPPHSVVFFSPSGVQFTEACAQQGVLPVDHLKVYALGPSTKQAVLERGYHLDGVASSPDPVSLLTAMEQGQPVCENIG